MKLRLHGTPAECATATQRLRHTPGLPLQGPEPPVSGPRRRWSASTSPSTATPAPAQGRERR